MRVTDSSKPTGPTKTALIRTAIVRWTFMFYQEVGSDDFLYLLFTRIYQVSADITITITDTVIEIPIETTGIRVIIPIATEMGD